MNLLDERRIRPMLAENSLPFNSPDFYFEPKWDGLRCIAYIQSGKVELQNRNLVTITNSYPECREIHRRVKSRTAILDGEIVVLEKGLPSFELLQNRFGVTSPVQVMKLSASMPVTFVAFDLLHLNGKDIIEKPVSYRKARLASIIEDDPNLLLSQFIETEGKSYFRKAIRLGFEGVIAKKSASIYQPGTRTSDWLKIKQARTTDCVIAGYTTGTGGRSPAFGALVMAAYDRAGNLTHIGNVGTGFSDEDLSRMMKMLRKLRISKETIRGGAEAPTPISWVKPMLVAEVGYMRMTKDMKLRFPRFIRLRLDGNPDDCTMESLTRHAGKR